MRAILVSTMLGLCPLLMACRSRVERTVETGPHIDSHRRATFQLRAPQAKAVEVILAPSPSQARRNFGTRRYAMTRDGEYWTGTTEALTPDIYAYHFSVDGMLINDPSNPHFIEEFGPMLTSKLSVPGALWTTQGATLGTIQQHRYQSKTVGGEQSFSVYVPPNSRAHLPLPTLYLLHGAGDDAMTWMTNGGVDVSMNNLIQQQKAKPMVIVMPFSYGNEGAMITFAAFQKVLLDEVMAQVEEQYPVARDSHFRAIAGVSMGGAQALSIGLRHSETFNWVGSFSAAGFSGLMDTDRSADPTKLPVDPARFRLLFMSCGGTDRFVAQNREWAKHFAGNGLRVVYQEEPNTEHVWPLWRKTVTEFLQLLFRDGQAHD